MLNTALMRNPINWVMVYLMVLLGYLMLNLVLTSINPANDLLVEN